MKNKFVIVSLNFIMILVFVFFIFLVNLQYIAFNPDFYRSEFIKYDVQTTTGMDINELMKVTDKIQGYLSNRDSNLQINIKVHGENSDFFNSRELQHMADVKLLFLKGFLLKNILGFTFIVLFLFIWLFYKKTLNNMFNTIYKGMIWFFLISGILAILIFLNFDDLFIKFHELFFNNDLWQLDVTKDKLIQMLPGGFFQDATLFTIRNSLITMLIITGVSYFLKGHITKKPL
ncbi:MAG: TIGR01906 family membrane protein [Thermoanaerobacteraceae bacterium]